jgi:hypothetical protein
MLTNFFRCLTYPHISLVCSGFYHVIKVQSPCCVCPLNLTSTYEGEHTIFGLWGHIFFLLQNQRTKGKKRFCIRGRVGTSQRGEVEGEVGMQVNSSGAKNVYTCM